MKVSEDTRFAETDDSQTQNSVTAVDELGVEINAKSNLRRNMSDYLFNQRMQKTYRERQEVSGWKNLVYAYQTLGVVYGDLGTSPLYVYPTVLFKNDPTEGDFLGILSLMFWTLTLIGVVKYAFIVLNADDHGEGGTFALYSYLCQHLRVKVGAQYDNQHKRLDSGKKLSHFTTNRPVNSATRHFLEQSPAARKLLLFIVMLGTCMVIGDGVLTPAISVLSAIDGLQTEVPSISSTVVQVLSAIVLVALFMLQRFGTSKVAFLFSPVMLLWFTTTPAIGVYNMARYYPAVLKALSPQYAVRLFLDRGIDAWRMLGGIVLCITGAEAMFADMGHFNKRSIQLAFSTVVYPSVMLTYAGQTAYLIKHPEKHATAFFSSIPKPIYWPMFLIASFSAVVASQALISASFSIVKQSAALGYFPRVKLIHTSSEEEGQVYSPEINYTLMILCIMLVFGFHGGPEIGNAFGLAVIAVMMITTILMTIVMLTVWQMHWLLAMTFFLLFGLIEGLYLTALLNKVPQGGWVPLAIGAVLLVIMLTWTYGRQKKMEYEMENRLEIDKFKRLLADTESKRGPGICFFYTDLMYGVPPVIEHYLKLVRSMHQVIVFTTIRFLPIKTVLPSERFLVGSLGFKGVYRCVAQYGYKDILTAEGDQFVAQIVARLKTYLESSQAHRLPPTQPEPEAADEVELQVENDPSKYRIEEKDLVELAMAAEHGAVFVLGTSRLNLASDRGLLDRIVIGQIYKFLRNNCVSAVDSWNIPPEKSLQIGMHYDL